MLAHKKPRQKKGGAAREATARNYDVVADARMLLQERMDMPRWFALYMGINYARKGVAGGALGEGKPAPHSLSQDVLEYIIELFDSVTIAEALKLLSEGSTNFFWPAMCFAKPCRVSETRIWYS